MCGKLNCSIWMLSKWNYFGDVVGEGVEAIKNNHRGLWGRHPIDIPASVSLLHETFWTAAGTVASFQLWHHLTKSVAFWHHHQCPPLLKNPLETFILLSRERPSLHTRSVTVAWQYLPPCGLQCSGHAVLYALEEIGLSPLQSGPCIVWLSCVQPLQESTKIAVDMGQTQVSVLWWWWWWWWCNASSSCLWSPFQTDSVTWCSRMPAAALMEVILNGLYITFNSVHTGSMWTNLLYKYWVTRQMSWMYL